MNSTKAKLRQDLLDAGWHSRGYLPHFEGGEIRSKLVCAPKVAIGCLVAPGSVSSIESAKNNSLLPLEADGPSALPALGGPPQFNLNSL